MDVYTDRVLTEDPPIPVEIVETDIDLYYRMAYSLYLLIDEHNRKQEPTVVIMPVGPVFQYRRFIYFLEQRPLDLSDLHCFFMDEYLAENDDPIPETDPLSFRGFICRELIDPMPDSMGLRVDQIHFPDPHAPEEYDRRLAELGGADVCYAGVGINGHLAFNEAAPDMSVEAFLNLPSRVIDLTPQTVTINSNTALGGAIEVVPARAVSVGFKQIFGARAIRVYLNRPWQRAVVRKLLYGPESAAFPASLIRSHSDATVTLTREVAEPPSFALK